MPEGVDKYREIIAFQYNIAERWLKRGRQSSDPFAQFSFYFAGFNALYFLWKIVDHIETGEGTQIDNLLRKLDDDVAAGVLDTASSSVAFFIKREPIQRMDKRTPQSPYTGERREGTKWRHKLADTTSTPVDRVVALGQILYLVRSNLVHGSKAESGDDEAIVSHAVAAVEAVLAASVEFTRGYLK
jgi:hypothetical protein